MEKPEWCGYRFENSFTRFDRIHERDGQTGGRTPHDGIGRACIASRGKNSSRTSTLFISSEIIALVIAT